MQNRCRSVLLTSIVARRPRWRVGTVATSPASNPAMNSDEVNSCSSWLLYCACTHPGFRPRACCQQEHLLNPAPFNPLHKNCRNRSGVAEPRLQVRVVPAPPACCLPDPAAPAGQKEPAPDKQVSVSSLCATSPSTPAKAPGADEPAPTHLAVRRVCRSMLHSNMLVHVREEQRQKVIAGRHSASHANVVACEAAQSARWVPQINDDAGCPPCMTAGATLGAPTN